MAHTEAQVGQRQEGPIPHFDIPYDIIPGFDPRFTSLDIYSLQVPGPHPIVIYVHGGAWREGDKSRVHLKPQAFAAAGYLFASTNHRLHPQARFPAHVRDLAKAIGYVRAHADRYGGDPSRIHLIGSSSGAHLVSLVATDDSYLGAEGIGPEAISGVVSLDTRAYDIPALMDSVPRRGLRLYMEIFGDDRASWEVASPTRYVARGKGIPPFLLAYTGGDPSREEQTIRFADRLRGAGVEVSVLAATNKTHTGLNQDTGREGDPVSRAVFEFIGRSASTRG